jgi:hypothetical protein
MVTEAVGGATDLSQPVYIKYQTPARCSRGNMNGRDMIETASIEAAPLAPHTSLRG